MDFLSISSFIMPGYDTLSEQTRITFEGSIPGNKFTQFIQDILLAVNKLKISSRWWYWFSGSHETRKQEFLYLLNQQKQELLISIADTNEYKTIISSIIHQTLRKEFPDYQLLTDEQQKLLIKSSLSQKLNACLSELGQQIEEQKLELSFNISWGTGMLFAENLIEDHILALNEQREEVITHWKTQFQALFEMDPFRKTIEDQKERIRKEQEVSKLSLLQEHATQLSTFFPLLTYRKDTTEKPLIDQLRAKYLSENGEVTAEPDKIDEEQLTDLLFHCMRQVSEIEIDFINLDVFNKKRANQMAIAVLKAFNDKSSLSLDVLFKEYESQLHQYITVQLLLINGKEWQVKDNTVKEGLFNSLSYLWNNNQIVSKTSEFLNKMADAHGFIQATSFSSRNDSTFLSMLDIYNYARHQEQISETRSILASLLSPLLPLYNEYKDIALYEKNPYWKSFRTIMPIILIAAFLILVSVILAPLALPTLAFAAVFIPAFLIGLALSNKYVSVKNDIYKYLREQYYGGPFEIPEFQVNTRMFTAFGTEENADRVRAFYIEELKSCDSLETDFDLKHDRGILTQRDIELRKENMTKRHHLSLEWYDIHSNKDLSYKQASLIVQNRLQQTTDKAYVHLKTTLQGELESIRNSVAEVTTDLKTTIAKFNKEPVDEKDKVPEATTIKANYRYGLFKRPNSLKSRDHLEELDKFSQQISLAVAS